MAELRKLVPADLYQFVLANDPQISPDGELIAFVRSHVEGEAKEYRSHIWVVPATGSAPPRPYTGGPRSDSQPRWSPDGRRLAFVRTIGEGPAAERQIWILPRDGGEAWQLTTMRHGATAPVWSPDGRYLAFTAAVGQGDTPEALYRSKTEADRKAEEQRAKDTARVVTRVRYKWDHLGLINEELRQHLFVVAVPAAPDGDLPRPVQVTDGDFDHTGAAWSPCGTMIATAAVREPDADYSRVMDVWAFPVPGQGAPIAAPVRVTANDGLFGGPSWSPDGRWIAATGHKREYTSATIARVWLFPAPGRGEAPVCLTGGWDRNVGDMVGADLRPAGCTPLVWAPDGSAVYAAGSDRGACNLFRVAVPGGEVTPVVGGRREVYAYSFDGARRRVAFAAGDIFQVGDVYCAEPGGEERRLSDLNGALSRQIAWPELLEFEIPAHDGRFPLHGWILKPVGFRPGVQYPAVLEIHGGPHTCYGYAFYQEMQLLAASGYAVIFANPRGSSSYGQEFERACQGDYGGHDYQDLMDCVDHAVSLGWIDPQRLGVTGGSYGGFMTNWIVGHTDRFAAAISHRSISNWLSFWGVSDIGPWFSEGEHGVDFMALWSGDLEKLWHHSPLKYVHSIKTPLQLMHSEHDLRCPMEQAEQLYLALKLLKRDVELIRHPRSNHDLTRQGPPVLRVDRFQHILRWFGTHIPVRPEEYSS